jgi:cyclic beta-1,2-glucan synthetase
LVKLFDPPFSNQERSPGYIVGYGQGFRENGGQYTHGAVWLAMAAIKCEKVDKGYEILNFLLPENHDLSRYAAEPFVLPADVYSAPNHEGEAGWTWYTGSAAWFFRVVTQELFGLKLRGGKLYIEPNLPKNMPNYSLTWRGRKIHCDHGHIYVDGEVYLGQGL